MKRSMPSSQLIIRLIVASAILFTCMALQALLFAAQIQQYLWLYVAMVLIELVAFGVGAMTSFNILKAVKSASRVLSRMAPADPAGDEGDAIDKLLSASARVASKVRGSAEELERLKDIDPLTGLGNRRWLRMRAGQELERARREASPISLIVVKVDRMADINRQFDHDAGDQALLSVGDLLRELVRPYDLVGRLTEDEFGVLLPGAELCVAKDIAARLRRAIESRKLALLGNLGITASFAVVERQAEDTWFDRFLARANAEFSAATAAKPDMLRPPP